MASTSNEDQSTSGSGALSLSEARSQTQQMVEAAVLSSDSVLVESPPAAGKTTSLMKTAAQTNQRLTYLTARTDLYQQAEKLCQKEGVNYRLVPSPHRDCPSFRGDHGDKVSDEAKRLYRLGISGDRIHRHLNLPCRSNCDYLQKRQQIDSTTEDLIIGHYQHAYNHGVINDRTVVLDEYPGDAYEERIAGATELIHQFLSVESELPFSDLFDLFENGDAELERAQAYEWYRNVGAGPDGESILQLDKSNQYHVLAPYLTFALLHSRDFGGNLRLSGFKRWEEFGIDRLRICVFDKGRNDFFVLTPPDFSKANHVVGLDGTPTKELWELVTRENFDHQSLFTNGTQRNEYVKQTLGLTIIQAGNGWKPYSGGSISPERDAGLLFGIRVREGQRPAMISPEKALQKYQSNGCLDHVKDAKNYGQVLSSNDYAGEELGVIMGTRYPGDHVIQRWGAYMRKEIERHENPQRLTPDFGSVGNRIFRHFVQNQVIQAILRFGRTDDNDATVYVNTRATPEWLKPDSSVRVEHFNTKGKRAISNVLIKRAQKGDGATVQQIASEVNRAPETVRRCLRNLESTGYITVYRNQAMSGQNLYVWDNPPR